MDGPELLGEVFSSKVRAAVLGHLLPRPHLGFSLTDLSRVLGLPVSSVQHECYKLERIGVIKARRTGSSRPYKVVAGSPLRAPLTALIAAALGRERVLRGAVDGVPGLRAAFLAGELPPVGDAGGGGAACFLVLVGEVPLETLDETHRRVEDLLGVAPATVELAFFRPNDWQDRIAQGNPHALGLMAGPRTELLGEGDHTR